MRIKRRIIQGKAGKIWIAVFLFVLAAGMCIVVSGEASAKKKEPWRLGKRYIAKGAVYQITALDQHGKTDIKDMIKGKKVKWTASSKNLVIKKNTIRAKKKGLYNLIGKTKKEKFILALYAVDRVWKKDFSAATVMCVQKGGVKDAAFIEDKAVIRKFGEMVNNAKPQFDYATSNHRLTGWTYRVTCYTASGRVLTNFTIYQGAVESDYRYRSAALFESYHYIEQLFHQAIPTPTPLPTPVPTPAAAATAIPTPESSPLSTMVPGA